MESVSKSSNLEPSTKGGRQKRKKQDEGSSLQALIETKVKTFPIGEVESIAPKFYTLKVKLANLDKNDRVYFGTALPVIPEYPNTSSIAKSM